jgi:RNA polymerase sigma-70 factor (ECF subfamily)
VITANILKSQLVKMEKKLSETQVIDGIRNDNGQAYTYLFKEYYNQLRFFALKFLGDAHQAEDIVLLTFSKLYLNKDRLNSLVNVKAYLYMSIKNACIDQLKRSQLEREYRKEFAYLTQDNLEETIENLKIKAELLKIISTEVEKLPEKYRIAFKLGFLNNMTNEEIALKLGITSNNVAKRKSRAVKMLRLRLLQQGLLAAYFLFIIALD